jgi:hypothetical protein
VAPIAAFGLNARVSYRSKRNINELGRVLELFPLAGAKTIKRNQRFSMQIAGFSMVKSIAVRADFALLLRVSRCNYVRGSSASASRGITSVEKL